jgi:hypothetical protein
LPGVSGVSNDASRRRRLSDTPGPATEGAQFTCDS